MNEYEPEFKFTIPQVEGTLTHAAQVAIEIGAVASAQVQNLRTRTNHPDGRPENVAEHSFMLSKVAPELAAQLYPDLDQNLVARFATVHDDVEVYVGDMPTDILANTPLDKEQIEAFGAAKLLKEYAHIPSYCDIIKKYEMQAAPEARFVRAVDKLMVLLIHLPNQGAVLRKHYTYESFLESETQLLERDSYKYGEFEEIMWLRKELGQYLADSFLTGLKTSKLLPPVKIAHFWRGH